MKFELFNSDGTSSGEKAIDNFPTFDGDKGVDALRQSIIAVHANKRQGNASTNFVQRLPVLVRNYIDKKVLE